MIEKKNRHRAGRTHTHIYTTRICICVVYMCACLIIKCVVFFSYFKFILNILLAYSVFIKLYEQKLLQKVNDYMCIRMPFLVIEKRLSFFTFFLFCFSYHSSLVLSYRTHPIFHTFRFLIHHSLFLCT